MTDPRAGVAVSQEAAPRPEQKLTVGLEEIRLSRDPQVVLACLGLGSCVAVCAYDPVLHVGAMAHVVLPESGGKDCEASPAKYADTGVPRLLKLMLDAGALKTRLQIKIAGGARIFANVKEGSLLDIGARNQVAVRAALAESGLKIAGENVGGTHGRSMLLHIVSGLALVTSAVCDTVEL